MSKEELFYPSVGELLNWAYSKREDPTYGSCWTSISSSIDNIAAFFDGTIQVQAGLAPGQYYDPQYPNSTTHILSLPVICSDDDIQEVFEDQYAYFRVYYPFFNLSEIDSLDKRFEKAARQFSRRVNRFCKFNKIKYIRLLQILNYKYNPIENYNMIESGEDNIDYTGTDTSHHTIDSNQTFEQTKINGPLAVGIGGEYSVMDTAVKWTSVAQSAQTMQGTTIGAVSIDNAGTSISASNTTGGETPTSSHYTTTYDDDATGRLQSYDTTAGDVGTAQIGTSKENILGTYEKTQGNPNVYSYTDTIERDGRRDEKDHSLERSGNIGVTTTQQMVEQERLMLEGFNIVKQFMEELSKEIFLQVIS